MEILSKEEVQEIFKLKQVNNSFVVRLARIENDLYKPNYDNTLCNADHFEIDQYKIESLSLRIISFKDCLRQLAISHVYNDYSIKTKITNIFLLKKNVPVISSKTITFGVFYIDADKEGFSIRLLFDVIVKSTCDKNQGKLKSICLSRVLTKINADPETKFDLIYSPSQDDLINKDELYSFKVVVHPKDSSKEVDNEYGWRTTCG